MDEAKAPQPARDDPEGSRPSRGARRAALAGAWISGLALAALIGSITAWIIDAKRPHDPPKVEAMINGRPVAGEAAADALREAGLALLNALTNRGDEQAGGGDEDASSVSDGAAEGGSGARAQSPAPVGSGATGARRGWNMRVDVTSEPRPAERAASWLFWSFIPLSLTGCVLGWIAWAGGARGGRTWMALWPFGLIIGIGFVAPSCSM